MAKPLVRGNLLKGEFSVVTFYLFLNQGAAGIMAVLPVIGLFITRSYFSCELCYPWAGFFLLKKKRLVYFK